MLVVTLAILGSALLTSSLLSAKARFHNLMLQQTSVAMSDAVLDLITQTQKNVRQNGINQLATWTSIPVTLAPQSACPQSTPPSTFVTVCKLFRKISWNITGYVRSVGTSATASQFGSEATNLAKAQNESRLSATINVAITDATGAEIYAYQSRQLTARLFHAAPYIVVTAERDVSSEIGSIASSEGDSAGYAQQEQVGDPSSIAPVFTTPSAFTDTRLLTTVDCKNTASNSSNNPQLDDNNVQFSQLRGVGNLSWVYEVPCNSSQSIDPVTAPIGYKLPKNDVYGTTESDNSAWSKNNDNFSSFGR